jgi:GDP/UDP-N,N'-diacetylbacillosamine 2-epimerase (hydrolysing)
MRKVCYVTGTRADFGLMRTTLLAIDAHPELELGVFVTGIHLDPEHGETVREVEQSGMRIRGRLPITTTPATGAVMARAVGSVVQGLTDELERDRPDVVLLLGDRGEMLASAIAALYLNIPVAHIHGGERSGTVDEPVRHAISKLSHWHFTATVESRERLVKMGEDPNCVHATGAPGLDDIITHTPAGRGAVMRRFGFDPDRKIAILIFHPVLQEADAAPAQIQGIVDALKSENLQVLAVMPNGDAGSDSVRYVLSGAAQRPDFRLEIHLPRSDLLDAMAHFDLLIGNSSAGIIEAASFGIPVVNVGNRQQWRQRNKNVTDVSAEPSDILEAVRGAMREGRYPRENVYGSGGAGSAIAELLASGTISAKLMNKANGY